MCQWGSYTKVSVPIPADLSHTGQKRWEYKDIDACIAPIVEALNKAGIETRASCCGHGREPGSIILTDGRTLAVYHNNGRVAQ